MWNIVELNEISAMSHLNPYHIMNSRITIIRSDLNKNHIITVKKTSCVESNPKKHSKKRHTHTHTHLSPVFSQNTGCIWLGREVDLLIELRIEPKPRVLDSTAGVQLETSQKGRCNWEAQFSFKNWKGLVDHGGSDYELCFLILRNTLGNCWKNMKQLKRKPRVWGSFNRFIFSFHYTRHPLLTTWPFGCVAIIQRNFWTLHLCASWDPWSSMVLKKTIRHWSKTRVGIIQFNMNTSIQYKQLRGLSHFRLVGF